METKEFTYQNVDLRVANVFDLTNDAEYLKKFLSPILGINNKSDYLNSIAPESRILDMFDYSETFQITELTSKLESVYKNELATLFNE